MSGPRLLQEARVFAARTVPAGFFHQSARFGKNVFNGRMSQRLSRETELKRSVSDFESRPCRAGETALKGFLSESTSRLHCADETEFKNFVSERAGITALEDSIKSRLPCAGETEPKNFVSERAGITALEDSIKASRWDRATASESEGIIGLRRVSKSRFDSAFAPSINSSMGVDLSVCGRVAAALPAAASASCVRTSPALRFSASAARASVSPLHSNSWSDTAGGLLPVCKSTSCSWGVGSEGPRGRRCTKGLVVRPKICVLSQRWRQE